MMAQSAIATKMKMKTFETLSGAAFMKMEPQEIAALSRDELVRLAFRVRAIVSAIATYIKAVEETTEMVKNFDIQCVADYESMKPQDITALEKDELELLVLRGQKIMQRCPIKPGCRFCSLPDEYYLHILLEWLTIEDQARFDMALLNHMDRRAHLHLLRDTEHGGVLSVSGNRDGYKFNSGVCAWLESRNVFMRALRFQDEYRDIPAGFLARTGRQLLKLHLRECKCISDAELGKLFVRCPRLEEVTLLSCSEIMDAALESLVQHCPSIHTMYLGGTQITDADLASLGGCWLNMKMINLWALDISDAGLGKFAKMCPNLEDVELDECSSITDVGLSSLVTLCQHIHTLNLQGTDVTGEGLARLGGRCINMKWLDINGLPIADTGLANIAKMCPNLETVSLCGCGIITDEGFINLVRNCERIHTLGLHGTQITGEGEGLALPGGSCRKNENMNYFSLANSAISDVGLGKITEMYPNLDGVNLSGCSSITDDGISRLVSNCQHIHTLALRGTQITGEGLARQGGGWRNIKRLDLSGLAISDTGLGKIAEKYPNLEDVNLGSCSDITDVGLSSLVRNCPHIHTVDLSATQVTGGGLAGLGEGWRNMKNLDLRKLAISDAGLGKIPEMCPNLEGLYLFACSNITDAGATSLAHLRPELRRLDLRDTLATAEGVASLREAYPDLDVTFWVRTLTWFSLC